MTATPQAVETTETTPEYALKEEVAAIHGVEVENPRKPNEKWTPDETKALYQRLNGLNRFALCLSGGGIRSASFALGVMQALADHPRPAKGAPANQPATSLLASFDYLSTVSGGGYIGSWLTLWIKRVGFPTVWAALTGRPCGTDKESLPISWLRENSNYLTPKVGLTSADFWTAVALYFRNLFLNWFVIVPGLACIVIALKAYAGLAAMFWREGTFKCAVVIAVLGTLCLLVSLRFSAGHRPSRKRAPITQHKFLWCDFLWAILAAVALSLCVAWAGGKGARAKLEPHVVSLTDWFQSAIPFALDFAKASPGVALMIATGVCFAIVYAASWLSAWPFRPDGGDERGNNIKDFRKWTAAGFAYGLALGLGAFVCLTLGGDLASLFHHEMLPKPLTADDLAGIFHLDQASKSLTGDLASLFLLDVPTKLLMIVLLLGVPWALFSQIFGEMIFVGLASYEKDSDADREWFGRKSGFLTAIALAWPVVMFLVFVGSEVAPKLWVTLKTQLGPIGGVAGLITLLVGKSSHSPAKAGEKGMMALSLNLVLAIAAPLFAAALVVLVSAVLDKVLLGGSMISQSALMAGSDDSRDTERFREWVALAIGLAVLLAIGFLASLFVNINRFSIHAIYRNRLIRAYLGASNKNRNSDLFTNFDLADNETMHALWPPKANGKWPVRDKANWRPFLVVNIALNIVSTKRLAWQERKAESFTTSPLHSGARCLAFRDSERYGGGISLGTAMAISGAAASPNMGYQSSTGVTFLMALFNVRLGWWLGNPGRKGEDTFTREGPNWAAKPLTAETFGLTTDESPFVYLSDGGHFENLGLYEMVRRRCRYIVVSDADCDPDFLFEDLGNAVRKIAIDLGIEITFYGLENLKKRPSVSAKGKDPGDLGWGAPYHAMATIHYDRADGGTSKPGILLYVKAGYHGVESAGVRSYALAHKAFPHETTADQWFTESQLESYRALGFEIMDGILTKGAEDLGNDVTLDLILEALEHEAAAAAAKQRKSAVQPPCAVRTC
jgi:Patatin-like phospholipase